MVSLFAESFEESTGNGNAMTTGNSSFTSLCTNWTFSNAHVLTGYGSWGGRSTATSGLAIGGKTPAWTAAPVVYGVAVFDPVTLPASDTTILQLRNGSTQVADLRLTASGALKWRDSSFIARCTSGTLLAGGGKQCKALLLVDATNGQMRLQVFAGANATGSTPDYDSGLVSVTGLGSSTNPQVGIVSSATADIYWSHVEFDDATYPGPAGNAPPTCSASASPTPANAGATVTLSGTDSDSDGTIASRQWTQTAGTSVTLTGATTATATFTAPSIAGGGNLTFQYQVTDNLGATATSTVTVAVLSSTASIGHRASAAPVPNSGTGATTSITIPAATQVGDKILVVYCGPGANVTGPSATSGWQQAAGAGAVGNVALYVWQKTAVSGDAGSTVTVTTAVDGTSAYKRALYCEVYSGARMGQASAVLETVAGTSHTAPGLTAESASAWVVTVVLDRGNPGSTSFTLPGNLTLDEQYEHSGGAAISSVVAHDDLVGAGTVGGNTVTGTVSTVQAAMATVILEPGTPSNPPPSVGMGPEQDNVEPWSTVTVGGTDTAQGAATIASILWQQLSGADVTGTLSSTTASTVTFTAPPTLYGTSVLLQKTVTDSTGASASARVLVVVLPVTERAVVNGEVPMRMLAAQ